jgi:hypothetical protein
MKTIINIVSAQTLPNYLFVKQMYEEGDKVIWIVSSNKKVQQAMSSLSNNLSDITNQQEISLTEGSEENVDCITNLLKEEIPLNDNYYVNLTGGTKLMAIAVYDFFKNNCKNVSFFYIPLPKNIIKNIMTQEERDITYRISISEYLSLYNIPISGGHKPYLSFEKAKDMFGKMSNIIERYPNELAELRELNDRSVFRRHKDQQYLFSKISTTNIKEGIGLDIETRAERIQNLIEQNKLSTNSAQGYICSNDMTYITGGWFEDLVYYITEIQKQPDDIICGIVNNSGSGNELDIVYTKNNKLCIIECKTGWDRDSSFNEIVYKAAAIKKSLSGLNIESSIYSYRDNLSNNDNKKGEEQLRGTLSNMGINYFGKKEIEDELNKLN